jgi:hypothetical protein
MLVQALYRASKCIIVGVGVCMQLACNTRQIHDDDRISHGMKALSAIEQGSQFRTLRSSVALLSVSPACLLTRSSLDYIDHTWSGRRNVGTCRGGRTPLERRTTVVLYCTLVLPMLSRRLRQQCSTTSPDSPQTYCRTTASVTWGGSTVTLHEISHRSSGRRGRWFRFGS